LKWWLLPSLHLVYTLYATFRYIHYCEPYHIIWAVSLLTVDLSAHSLTTLLSQKYYYILYARGKRLSNPFCKNKSNPTKIGFAENQLSLSLISLSPLFTSYPKILPHLWVESSSIKTFNLDMNRSLSFGSNFTSYALSIRKLIKLTR
jgi:hypothetical protein